MMQHEKKPEGGLLQSSEWMAVLRAEDQFVTDVHSGRDVLYGVEHQLFFVGRYVYFPRAKHVTAELLEKICALPYAWVRIDADNEDVVTLLHEVKQIVVRAPHDMQPRSNLIVDLSQGEELLLQNMKSKTRYNIRLAQKKDVKVIVTRDNKYIDHLYKLVKETANRKDVSFHTKDHYMQILTALPDDTISLYVAEYEGKVIAVNMMAFYGGTATYLHGATSDDHRNVMAPFLLQWRAMQDAIARGCTWYDLGGMFLESDDPGKRGITRFKQGFASDETCYDTQGSFDIILSKFRYDLYRTLRKLRG